MTKYGKEPRDWIAWVQVENCMKSVGKEGLYLLWLLVWGERKVDGSVLEDVGAICEMFGVSVRTTYRWRLDLVAMGFLKRGKGRAMWLHPNMEQNLKTKGV